MMEAISGPGHPATAKAGSAPIWLDLINPTHEEERQVEALVGVNVPTREEMKDIEVSARLYLEDGAEFMTITAVAKLDTEEPVTTPITFVLKGSTLVTVRYEEFKSFSNFATRVQKPHTLPCATAEQIAWGLFEALCDRLADALEQVGVDIDSISQRVFRRKPGTKAAKTTQDLQSIIEKIGQDGDLLTMFHESLVSINRALTYHTSSEGEDKRVSAEAKARAKVLTRDVVALSDQAAFLSNKVTFLLDATLGLINLQQNQIIKIFSVAAVVFPTTHAGRLDLRDELRLYA